MNSISPIVATANSDLLQSNWALDNVDTSEAPEFFSTINAPNAIDSTSNTFLTGWVGANLAPYNGTTFSAAFSQTGTYSDGNIPNDLEWFVFAEPTVQCLQGITIYYEGAPRFCFGRMNSTVSIRPNTYDEYALYIY